MAVSRSPDKEKEREMLELDLLKQVGCFSELDGKTLKVVQKALRPVSLSPGSRLCAEGEIGDRMYIIEFGEVSVKRSVRNRGLAEIAVLRRGDIAGEMGLFRQRERSATLDARSECKVWEVEYDTFERLIGQHTGLANGMLSYLSTLLARSGATVAELGGLKARKASDLFVEALEAEGVEYVFGVPGEESLDLLDSLCASEILFLLTRHEQTAGFMAATYGRLTGKAGVCLATLGPGATNLVTAAAYAQLGAMPMLMITGQKPVKTSKQGQFQIVDVVDMMRPLTKYTRQIVSGDNIPTRVREAFRLIEEERPGAGHLELPEDIAVERTDMEVIEKSHVRRPMAEEKAIVRAVDMIKAAKCPLLLIGAAANRKLTSRMLRRFVDRTGIPFFTTQMGKGVLDERDSLYLGNATLSDNDFLHCAIRKADVIINVGHDIVEKPPFFMEHGGMQVIHINFTSAVVDPVYFPQVEVTGDIANTVWQISERIQPQELWDFTYFMKIKGHLEDHLAQSADDDRFPIYPQRLVADVRRCMPDDGIIALDNGMYKIWFARNYKAHQPNTVLLDNALATMGAGLPSAMAARLVFPDRKVMAICGDGGFMMNSQELETAVRLNMNLVILVLRDNGYGMIKWKQANMKFREFGLDFGNPDFVKYAESYGAVGHRVEATEDLVPLLEKCCDTDGVHLIDLPIDYSDNDRILNQELPQITQQLPFLLDDELIRR